MALENWKQELCQTLAGLCQDRVEVIGGLWDEMGLTDVSDRVAVIRNYIDKSFNKMIQEEKCHLKEIVLQVQTLVQKRANLRRELNRNSGLDHNELDEGLVNLPLIKLVSELKKIIKDLEVQKEDRMVEVNRLMVENKDSSRWVGEEPLRMPPDTILVPSELDQLREHVRQMKELRRRRTAQLEEMQIEVDRLCQTLGVEPQAPKERELLVNSVENCVLSEDNLKIIRNFLDQLQRHFKSNSDRREDMISRIKSICGRLNYSQHECAKYLPVDDNVSDKAIQALASSLQALEELKKQHMRSFIEASRKELEQVWERLYLSDEQKAKFLPFHSGTVDEETLDKLEVELDRLNKYYEHNLTIYNKVDEWHQVWRRKLELEAQAKDKGRLLGRGRNNLLEEEKERRAVGKRLPRVQAQLTTLIDAYNEANADPFVLGGMGLLDYIHDLQNEHKEEVMDEKMARNETKRKLLRYETRYGAQPLTPINVTSAALMKSRRELAMSVHKSSSVKRLGTDTLPNAKRRKVNDSSVLCGNLPQHAADSVASTTAFNMGKDVVSSTFCGESQRMTSKTPRQGHLTSTPSKFKTPTSTVTKSRLLRSSNTTSATAAGRKLRNLQKVPFKF